MLKKIIPDYMGKRLYEIDIDYLSSLGFRLILIDIDNTLLPDSSINVSKEAEEIISKLKKNSCELCLLSNASYKRASLIAKILNVHFIAPANKPSIYKLQSYISEKMKLNRWQKKEIVLIGDQIFTDILCAKRLGINSILVEKISDNERWWIKIKRLLEILIKKYLFSNQKIKLLK